MIRAIKNNNSVPRSFFEARIKCDGICHCISVFWVIRTWEPCLSGACISEFIILFFFCKWVSSSYSCIPGQTLMLCTYINCRFHWHPNCFAKEISVTTGSYCGEIFRQIVAYSFNFQQFIWKVEREFCSHYRLSVIKNWIIRSSYSLTHLV